MNKDTLISIIGLIIAVAIFLGLGLMKGDTFRGPKVSPLAQEVLPLAGIPLIVKVGDLPAQLEASGAIDATKFKVAGVVTDPLVITKDNAHTLLNFFWALGLANKNEILTAGPMATEGETANFASTGGWTLAVGEAMDHYAKHELIVLTAEQQKLVEEVSKNVYRPCCNNPTHFPDCNHGMAMLGLLELGASQGLGEKELYRLALIANSYWFSDTYLTIAEYLEQTGVDWAEVDPKELVGKDYSSGTGFAKIKAKVVRTERGLGTSCGV
ncbi:MAG: hypothetical protein Q7T49_00520 [bacterium]|nr:hypothetical protein [bacterium]